MRPAFPFPPHAPGCSGYQIDPGHSLGAERGGGPVAHPGSAMHQRSGAALTLSKQIIAMPDKFCSCMYILGTAIIIFRFVKFFSIYTGKAST